MRRRSGHPCQHPLGLAIDARGAGPPSEPEAGGCPEPALHSVALRAVYDCRAAYPDAAIVGVGGIADGEGALRMLMAGANAVQVGTATLADPGRHGGFSTSCLRTLERDGSGAVRRSSGPPKDDARTAPPGHAGSADVRGASAWRSIFTTCRRPSSSPSCWRRGSASPRWSRTLHLRRAGAVQALAGEGFEVFLDVKLHDIPTTVGRGAEQAGALGVTYLTVHAAGGNAMVRAAVDGFATGSAGYRTKAGPMGPGTAAYRTKAGPIGPGTAAGVLGVTVLTSEADAPPETLLHGRDRLVVRLRRRSVRGRRRRRRARCRASAAHRRAGYPYVGRCPRRPGAGGDARRSDEGRRRIAHCGTDGDRRRRPGGCRPAGSRRGRVGFRSHRHGPIDDETTTGDAPAPDNA